MCWAVMLPPIRTKLSKHVGPAQVLTNLTTPNGVYTITLLSDVQYMMLRYSPCAWLAALFKANEHLAGAFAETLSVGHT